MSQFSKTDLLVLEEILYSSLNFPIERLQKNLSLSKEELLPIIDKLSETALFHLEESHIVVDKEMRKYYEFQILKFEDNFIPDLEFLQGMLKKVPIHVLPNWYSIPRTSDNIFQSLIEKYFLTPQAFQRYLLDINLGDPVLTGIVQDVFNNDDLKVPSQELMDKYDLTKERFEECLLLLEFNLLCCQGYDSRGSHWREVVTPFREWREYLLFLRETCPQPLPKTSKLIRRRPADFAFVLDMSALLKASMAEPLSLRDFKQLAQKCDGLNADEAKTESYLNHLIDKMRLLRLADCAKEKLYPLEQARDFLNLRTENKALFLYRHPLNCILNTSLPSHILNERNMREAEKAISRVLDTGWVFFDDFIKGALIPFTEETRVKLTRRGKGWKYSFPHYSEEEIELIRATLFEWLFEAGIVAVGMQDDRPCFCATPFGQNLFGS
ncbi:MAG: hypothetical protein A2Y28_04550 [Chlamydiae bacterium GWC2_50_10]|nr:MAG: hypothetical protein A2Z85_02810 [Chlamydiae bacterium GWA2_50_15]OGN54027.1 MAG: hypothetical protein A2098_00395 [Chlamydiae bacterium GWF2_49_8]OGN54919.1 MAG: hypothetical protein A2Y28_04550 [Chlamydiae bacterium GWC2_50_10]OGN62864.1 MAG: hypothetical protein A3E26_01830 [Chlamydiae bacterium RIFCSPHIGHO2_12_FULL_49_32]OGN70046.1 MAG: hypothetical protein A3I15_02035 [Chlamydiae bacterium RIFCSPLOWO2_02_FULL_49_12]OGN74686.1 MAG: hypothetical protein A3G30_01035 [Chlamydiae bacte